MTTRTEPSTELTAPSADEWHGGLEFRTLAETIPALVFVTDAHGRNIYTNVQFQRFAGLRAAELLGDGWLAVLHPDDRERADEVWARSVKTKELYEARYRFARSDGSYRWHLVRGTPMLNATGDVVRWMGSCTDIEDLVRSAKERERFDAFLRVIGTSDQLVLYIKDEEGRFVFVNDAVLGIMGCARSEILGRSLSDFPNRLSEQIAINDRIALEAGTPLVFEESWPGPNGERYFRSVKAPLPLGDGRTGLAAVSYEITDEHDLRLQKQALHDRLLNWLEAMPMIAWESDATGCTIAVSQAWRDAARLGQLPGPFDLTDVIVERDRGRIDDLWRFAVATGEALDTETSVYDQLSREEHPVRLLAMPGRHAEALKELGWYGSMIPRPQRIVSSGGR